MKTLLLYLFIFLSILHNQNIIEQNQKTLLFFMNQLLPSLFILCVFVQLIPTPIIKKQRRIRILNIDLSSLFLVIKMIFLGNPGNSYIINQLIKEKQITIQQAKRLIYCISIPSISFMLMTIPYLYNKVPLDTFITIVSPIINTIILAKNPTARDILVPYTTRIK